MIYILVDQTGQIAGSTDNPLTLPGNLTAHKWDGTTSFELLYFDGSGVKLKPTSPGSDYNWDWIKNVWVAPLEPYIPPAPNLSSNPLLVAIYDHLKTIDAPLADAIALLFSMISNDYVEIEVRKQILTEQFTPKIPK